MYCMLVYNYICFVFYWRGKERGFIFYVKDILKMCSVEWVEIKSNISFLKIIMLFKFKKYILDEKEKLCIVYYQWVLYVVYYLM